MKIIVMLILLYSLPILFSIVGETYQEALAESRKEKEEIEKRMIFVTVEGMNNLIAYGAPDGDYYTVDEWKGKLDMRVVAKVRNGNIEVKAFKNMKEAMGWVNY